MPAESEIRKYYDDHNMRVLVRDYVFGNRRFDKAVQCVIESVPRTVKSILDVGCGIGHSSWLFKEAFPEARITGVDISDRSIKLARKLFQDPNLSFETCDLSETTGIGLFDFVVMIDVYEHFYREQRPSLHLILKDAIKDDGWLVITTPTIEHQAFLRETHPERLQVVDEDVTIDDLIKLAKDVGLSLVRLEKVAVWRLYDYQHFVGRKFAGFKEVPPASVPGLIARVTWKIRTILDLDSVRSKWQRVKEILGFDPLAQ
jgi:2-polyprenyl-3-methyl-5-hydroxy-6-metoxy-1,4-benzoquinol methylase